MYEQWYLRVIFLSVGLRIYFLLPQIEMQYNQVDTFTMMTFLLGNIIGVKKQISFKKNAVVQCFVSACARKYFIETQPSSLNLAFFYFSVKAVSIGIPECFRIPANADIWTRNQ